MSANASSSPIVSSITLALTKLNWPTTVVVSNGYLVKAVPYSDSNPGINWKIVVLIKQDTYSPTSAPIAAGKTTATPTAAPSKPAPTKAPTRIPTGKPSAKPFGTGKPTRKPTKRPA